MNKTKNLLRMVNRVIQNVKNYTKYERIIVIEILNVHNDKIEKGEIEDVSLSTCERFLNEWTKPVQTFEKVLDFSTCFVENAVMFFKGLKRLRRRSSTKTQSKYYFSGVV